MAKNNPKALITSDNTYPLSSAATGTITKVNNKKIVGVGTLFTTEFSLGDWLYVPSINEIAQIVNIVNNLECTIDSVFAGAVSGAVFRKTPISRFSEISAVVKSGTATIDGVLFSAGSGSDDKYESSIGATKHADPIVIVTIGEVYVTSLYN